MLRSQKNQIYELVTQAGLSPGTFEWVEVNPHEWVEPQLVRHSSAEKLQHIPSGLHFVFVFEGKEHQIEVAVPTRIGTRRSRSRPSSWASVTKAFERWLKSLVKEAVAPDLWEESKRGAALAPEFDKDTDNSPFSPVEQERIATAIADLKQLLLSSNELTDAQIRYVDGRLEHMQDASARLGRKDWVALAMGTLSSIAIGAALAPEAARNLIASAGALFGWVMDTLRLITQ